MKAPKNNFYGKQIGLWKRKYLTFEKQTLLLKEALAGKNSQPPFHQ